MDQEKTTQETEEPATVENSSSSACSTFLKSMRGFFKRKPYVRDDSWIPAPLEIPPPVPPQKGNL